MLTIEFEKWDELALCENPRLWMDYSLLTIVNSMAMNYSQKVYNLKIGLLGNSDLCTVYNCKLNC